MPSNFEIRWDDLPPELLGCIFGNLDHEERYISQLL